MAKRRETTENIYILCIYIFSSLLVSFCRKRRKKNRNFSLSFFPRRSNLLRSWCKVSLTLGHVSCLGWSSYSPFLGWSKYSPFGLEYIFTFMGWSINIRLFSVSFQRRRTSSGSRLESLKESSPRSRRRFFRIAKTAAVSLAHLGECERLLERAKNRLEHVSSNDPAFALRSSHASA